MLRIRLLGPIEVREGERVLEIRRRKQRALLAVLALRSGEAVSADRLVEDIWGERAPRTARHALENYVSELRRTLGRDVIRTEPAGYALAVDPEQVDSRRLERLLERTDDSPAERAARLREELSHVRGEPIEDLAFEPFAHAAVPRLLELVLAAHEELAGLELALGRHKDVVATLEQLVTAHPYREHLRALLMLALYRSGRQAEALSAYQEGRRVLVDELGIDPGEGLQEMERAILRQDESLRPPPRVTGRHAAVKGTLPRRETRKTVTVVVATVANTTELALRVEPEGLRALLDRFGEVIHTASEQHGGVARVVSGRALAVFGVPMAHEDDAVRAVRAAVEMRQDVGILNDGLLPEHGVFIEVRTGIETGEALITPEGGDIATGRPVTVADELERAASAGQILLGKSTCGLVNQVAEVEAVAADIYRLVELREDVSGRELRLDSPMVGRRRQLGELSGAFQAAVSERALHLVTVLGAPGAGKSRLAREFLAGLGDVATVLHGQCLPYGDAITFSALTSVVGADAPSDPTVSSVRGALEALARERPVVLVLEDLHWAEPPLLDVVENVAATSEGAPILVLAGARSELLETRAAWGAGNPNAHSIVVEPLTEAESERLVDNLLGEADLPDSVKDYVVETAGGNPLFLEELLATLVDRDVLQRRKGRWTTTQALAIPLPGTIQAGGASRIDRLPDEERLTLELASVEGRSFSESILGELASASVDLDAVLAALVRKELVRRQPADDVRYTFRHQLIRDAAYESMPLQTRAELHARVAELLARSGAESDEPVLYHSERARRYREALGLF